jgi:hypothetical protein
MKKYNISSAGLHILAMFFMLLDHLWATVVPGNEWLTCAGRLAFPIFAFLIAEGAVHTRDLKKYMGRLLTAALISEIPFNLMCSGRIFYPIHQNVLWTFLIALCLIRWNEKLRDAGLWRRLIRFGLSLLAGFLLGTVTFVDYYGYGIMMVLVFWFFRGRSWWQILGQIIGLYWINVELMGGLVYEFEVLGRVWVLHQQGLALLALIPIWLYRGRKGNESVLFRFACYFFYPAHILLLVALMLLGVRF